MSLNPEQLEALEVAALAAVGRKEMKCQVGMADIYKDAGLMAREVVIPRGNRDWACSQSRSLITEWVEASGLFDRIDAIEPGALLCFRLLHTDHHVSIALSGGRAVHVAGLHGIQIAAGIPDAWAKRISSIWRLKT